ncbi:hypothetical protein, partial [Micrococcus yunnanensis]|uniref:hypothetical protein n=1 Tax=Micrococcus yunnanensis TaxID=566027 RepID=UPI0031DC5667
EFRRLLNPMDLWKIRMSHFNGKQKESPKRKEHTLPMLFGLFFRIGKYKVLPARKPITSNVNHYHLI